MTKILSLLISISIIALTLSACHKDESMQAIITVKLMSDTSVNMPGVRVELTKGDINVGGYTDGNGKFSYTFENPIKLDIHAYNDSLSGNGTINLNEFGIDYKRTIYIL